MSYPLSHTVVNKKKKRKEKKKRTIEINFRGQSRTVNNINISTIKDELSIVAYCCKQKEKKKGKEKKNNRNKLSRSVANGKQYKHQHTFSYSS